MTRLTNNNSWAPINFSKGLVSVIVPTYNRASLMMGTLNSVYAQSYRPIELIVIDDGSTDGTLEVLEQFKASTCDTSFSVHIHRQENSGVQLARTNGFINSTGEYIQYVDSDDLLYPDKILEQVNDLKLKPNVDISYGKARTVSHDGVVISTVGEKLPENKKHARFAISFWSTDSVLFRRHVVHALGPWDPDIKGNEDVLYDTRIKLAGFKTSFTDTLYVDHTIHQHDSISRSNILTHVRECEKAGNKIWRLFEDHQIKNPREWDVLATRYMLFAWQYKKFGEKSDIRRCIFIAFKIASLKQKVIISIYSLALEVLGYKAMLAVKNLTSRIRPLILPTITPQK